MKGHKNEHGQPEAEIIMLKMDGIQFEILMSAHVELGSANKSNWG